MKITKKVWTKEQVLVDLLTVVNILFIKSSIFKLQQGIFSCHVLT